MLLLVALGGRWGAVGFGYFGFGGGGVVGREFIIGG